LRINSEYGRKDSAERALLDKPAVAPRRMAAFLTVYRPLVWVDRLWSFDRSALLEWHFEAWGI
jgi:hypothetical protein